MLKEKALIDGFSMDDRRDRDVKRAKKDARSSTQILHPNGDNELAIRFKVGLCDVKEEGFIPLKRIVCAEDGLRHVLLFVE